MNLFDAIFGKQTPSVPALLFQHKSLSYSGLREQTVGLATALRSLNLAEGTRVAILLHDSPEFMASFISVCSQGAIAVPINMALRLEEQYGILSDCTAEFAIVEADLCSRLLTGAGERLRHLRELIVVCRSESEQEPVADLQRLRESGGEGLQIRFLDELTSKVEGRIPPAFPEDREGRAAFILYTSGSTGDPKGAVHTQDDIFYTNETFCRQVLQLRSGDRLFSSSRLPFAYGLGNSFTFPLLNGMTSILCREKPTPEVIHSVFAEYRPTIFFGVPVIYNLLLDYHRRVEALDCSSLRLCISAGEALPAQLGEDWERTFGVQVLDGIGSTEMLHMFFSNLAGDVRYGSSGRLLGGYEAQLLDEHGNAVETGSEGNLWVKGASAAQEYWRRPEVTAKTFVAGWVRTGDLYRRDADGYWFHMGRSDDCFKSSGQWVSPVEVEGVLIRHEKVSQTAVVEDFDERKLPCPCAFIVSNDVESMPSKLEQELRQLAREALPRFKQPRRYIFVKQLPYTATGKIQRFKLRAELRAGL